MQFYQGPYVLRISNNNNGDDGSNTKLIADCNTDTNGTQYLHEDEGNNNNDDNDNKNNNNNSGNAGGAGQQERTCFRCDRVGKCLSGNCTEPTKEDGLPVNNQETTNQLYNKATFESMRCRLNNNQRKVGVAQHFMGSKIIPTSKEEPYEEFSGDGFALVQQTFFSGNR